MLAFFKGLLLAFAIAFGVGPGLILQFDASINRGFFYGAVVVIGQSIGDLALLTIGYLGFIHFLENGSSPFWMGLICGAVIIVFGMIMLLKRSKVNLDPNSGHDALVSADLFHLFLKGILINITNPFLMIFWFGLLGFTGSHYGTGSADFFAFFIGLFGGALVMDLTKCYVFYKVKHFFKPSVLIWINRISGSALVAAGIYIIFKSTMNS